MRSTDYDFLSAADRRWIARCRLLAVVLFLGLLSGLTLYEATQDAKERDTPSAATSPPAPPAGTSDSSVAAARSP